MARKQNSDTALLLVQGSNLYERDLYDPQDARPRARVLLENLDLGEMFMDQIEGDSNDPSYDAYLLALDDLSNFLWNHSNCLNYKDEIDEGDKEEYLRLKGWKNFEDLELESRALFKAWLLTQGEDLSNWNLKL